MKEKKRIVFVVLALLLSMPVVLLGWGFALPPQFEESFMGELKHKVRLLENTPGPRIILVGGSGVAFGVDSELMERELPGYSVVNFGMYAALGTTVMLDLSQPYIQAGDIVILIPEQQEQTLSDWFDPAVMWQGLDGACQLLAHLPGEKLEKLAGAFPEFAGQKFSSFLQGGIQGQGIYCKSSFNERGDVASALCAQNVMPGGVDINTPIYFDPAMLNSEFLQRVKEYSRAVQDRDALLWYGFCPMNTLAVEGTAENIDAFYAEFQQRTNLPLAGNPHKFILDAGWFYDTNFHLNSSGKTVYTRELIRAVKAILDDSSSTNIPLPAMPSEIVSELWKGNDQDENCFVYEEYAGGLTITGLTTDGLHRTTLTVPSHHDGVPVTSIGAGSFSGADRLESVIVQQNIRTIFDGAFGGCEGLKHIIMQQSVPSFCQVGQRLLDGTQAKIYVPEDCLAKFRTDYFWAAYGSKIVSQKIL